eukprot:CAMPEP_0113719502 /NCGR_PEP_ID=MMETSP0038_2-20120614/35853_1 /TAXON_ID=2898 /ORGANISM="Cryptomonas paramecium" /LENGTH=352 /DNA_ID=CAMNT_0000647887 /DNA_START=513 /DNA_END=1572 /DNA_ORIENTATION=+ /assembly_acc=CAM_ASM_000170
MGRVPNLQQQQKGLFLAVRGHLLGRALAAHGEQVAGGLETVGERAERHRVRLHPRLAAQRPVFAQVPRHEAVEVQRPHPLRLHLVLELGQQPVEVEARRQAVEVLPGDAAAAGGPWVGQVVVEVLQLLLDRQRGQLLAVLHLRQRREAQRAELARGGPERGRVGGVEADEEDAQEGEAEAQEEARHVVEGAGEVHLVEHHHAREDRDGGEDDVVDRDDDAGAEAHEGGVEVLHLKEDGAGGEDDHDVGEPADVLVEEHIRPSREGLGHGGGEALGAHHGDAPHETAEQAVQNDVSFQSLRRNASTQFKWICNENKGKSDRQHISERAPRYYAVVDVHSVGLVQVQVIGSWSI